MQEIVPIRMKLKWFKLFCQKNFSHVGQGMLRLKILYKSGKFCRRKHMLFHANEVLSFVARNQTFSTYFGLRVYYTHDFESQKNHRGRNIWKDFLNLNQPRRKNEIIIMHNEPL